ncbi:MAG: hypothetical protein ACTIKR_00065 [Advenella sp.]|uniref:hypothetical protein n=1 Tax=unclassified Advenella TaxID=2685285 RepID=UPI001868BACE|nr:hypothetical protein [Advenella sp. FME57]
MGARIGYGNHSQDASLEFDGKIITTRTWQERVDTLRASPILPIEIHQKYTAGLRVYTDRSLIDVYVNVMIY